MTSIQGISFGIVRQGHRSNGKANRHTTSEPAAQRDFFTPALVIQELTNGKYTQGLRSLLVMPNEQGKIQYQGQMIRPGGIYLYKPPKKQRPTFQAWNNYWGRFHEVPVSNKRVPDVIVAPPKLIRLGRLIGLLNLSRQTLNLPEDKSLPVPTDYKLPTPLLEALRTLGGIVLPHLNLQSSALSSREKKLKLGIQLKLAAKWLRNFGGFIWPSKNTPSSAIASPTDEISRVDKPSQNGTWRTRSSSRFDRVAALEGNIPLEDIPGSRHRWISGDEDKYEKSRPGRGRRVQIRANQQRRTEDKWMSNEGLNDLTETGKTLFTFEEPPLAPRKKRKPKHRRISKTASERAAANRRRSKDVKRASGMSLKKKERYHLL